MCIICFPSHPVVMAVLKDSKRRAIVGASSIFLGAKFIFSTDAVYKSDNMETNRTAWISICKIFDFLLIFEIEITRFTYISSGRKAVNHRKVNFWYRLHCRINIYYINTLKYMLYIVKTLFHPLFDHSCALNEREHNTKVILGSSAICCNLIIVSQFRSTITALLAAMWGCAVLGHRRLWAKC